MLRLVNGEHGVALILSTGDVTLEDDGFIAKLPKRALINGTRLAADLASELRDMIAL